MHSSTGLVLALLLATPGLAQSGDPGSGLAEAQRNDRERMHPGDPLLVVGVGQGDNHFLENTPALLGADTAVALVDAEENHARRLALYETGTHFDAPPSKSKRMTAGDPRQGLPTFRSERTAQEDVPEEQESERGWLLPGLFAGLLLLVVGKTVRG